MNTLEQNGLKIALTHGHGSLWNYLLDKFWFMVQGYDLNRYLNLLHQAGKDAGVVVFGHTHHTEITFDQGRLLLTLVQPVLASRQAYHPPLVFCAYRLAVFPLKLCL